MTPSARYRPGGFSNSRALHAAVFLIAMTTFGLNGANAYGQNMRHADLRVAVGTDQFEEVRQVAVAFGIRPPRRLRMNRFELVVGTLSTTYEQHAMLSFGPVWQFQTEDRRWFVDLGISPTLLSGSTFGDRDLGGAFHFTSYIATGVRIGARRDAVLALRIQHTSNAGINDTNPGLDMVGLNASIGLGRR